MPTINTINHEISILPNEVISEILTYLNILDLYKFRRVNSVWTSMCSYHILNTYRIKVGKMVKTTKTLMLSDSLNKSEKIIKIRVCSDSTLRYDAFYHLWDFLFELNNSYSFSIFHGTHSWDDSNSYYKIHCHDKTPINQPNHFKGIRYFLGNSGMCATYDLERDTFFCFRAQMTKTHLPFTYN